METRLAEQAAAPERILLAHGGGGELTRRLIEERIRPRLGNPVLDAFDDGAVLPARAERLVFTTDSFVVQPLTFPGGDIGRLAVCGTVNDLAVMGAVPVALSLALIIEEGLPAAVLDAVLDTIAATADEAGVRVVTGDTKVIERRGGDGLMINTSGLGYLPDDAAAQPGPLTAGDVVMVTGRLAEHGLAIMAVREGISFATELRSDVAPLNGLTADLRASGGVVKFMRDPTRGGVAGVLADLAESTDLSIEVNEAALPLSRAARHLAEALGLDPLNVANEGKCVLVCAPEQAEVLLQSCRRHPYGRHAAVIGRVTERRPAIVEMITHLGGRRVIQRPYGEDLPRIC